MSVEVEAIKNSADGFFANDFARCHVIE
jgi:hypothetical protein